MLSFPGTLTRFEAPARIIFRLSTEKTESMLDQIGLLIMVVTQPKHFIEYI